MKFSIIIPVYNRAHIVHRTLDSVVAQTHRPLELVLVDNCSTDDTLAVLQRFASEHEAPDLHIAVVQESHHTAGAARNRGFEKATGEWVIFFDSDDEMAPHLVERYNKVIGRHNGELDVVSARSRVVMPDGTTLTHPYFKHDIFAVHILHSQLSTQRYAVRREFFASTDGWNINLPGWNDWESGMRLLLARPRIAFMGGRIDINIIHSGTESITGTEFHSRHGQWEHVIDVIENEVRCSSLKNKRRYYRLLDYRRMVLAAQYEREGHPELARPLCRLAYANLQQSYDNSLAWRVAVSPILKWLFRRIVDGRRGSARIARLILR